MTVEAAPEITTLTLIVTFRCNYRCRHCVFRCSPERKETMDARLGVAAVRALRRVAPTLQLLNLTGGEPFLEPDLMTALMAEASAAGLQCGVVSNSYWATSFASAKAKLAMLHSRGLTVFTTSLDAFHSEFGSTEQVRHAVLAAREIGLQVHLNIVAKRGSGVRAETAHEVLGLEREALEGVSLHEVGPTLVGFASDFVPVEDVHRDRLHVIAEPCAYVLRSITIAPDGSLYGCCGVGGASDNGPARLLHVGQFGEETLETTIEQLQRNLMFHIIAKAGPQRLIELALQRDPSIPTRARFSHICDVCHEITHNGALREGVAEALHALVAKHAAESSRD